MTKRFAKKLIIVLLIMIMVALSANIITFGYYYANQVTKPIEGGTNFATVDSDARVVKVSTAKELYQYAVDKTYNNSNMLSGGGDRWTVLLTGDITLVRALEITADINIDMGGHTIDLAGNDMVWKHSYAGVIEIYNGIITNSLDAAQLVYNTPNAMVENRASIDSSITVENVAVSTSELIESSFNMIVARLNGVDTHNMHTLATNTLCKHKTRPHNTCTYISQDADLPINYYGYDVAFDYTSSDTTIISHNGNVNNDGMVGINTAVLTASVTVAGQKTTRSYYVHIFNTQDSLAVQDVAKVSMGEYMQKFYNTSLDKYNISQASYLPKFLMNNAVVVSYSTQDAAGNIIDSTDNINYTNFDVIGVDGYKVNLDENVTKLVANVGGQTVDFAVDGSDVSSINDNYTKAIQIARELYGLEVVVKQESGYNGYTKTMLHDDATVYASKGVLNIEYATSFDIDKTYAIGVLSGDTQPSLHVLRASNPPTILQNTTLKMRFTFDSDPASVTINIPIRYDDGLDSDGNAIAKFLPYYMYFDKLFLSRSGGFGMETVKVPCRYEDDVIYYLQPTRADGNQKTGFVNMVLQCSIGGSNYIYTVEQVKAMTAAELKRIVDGQAADWIITIDGAKLSQQDIEVGFKYYYKFTDFGGGWNGDEGEGYYTYHTMPGVYNTTVDILDVNLYTYLYNCMKPTGYHYTQDSYKPNSGMYIFSSWLDREFVNENGKSEIDNTNNRLSIFNYKGIGYIHNVKSLSVKKAFQHLIDAKKVATVEIGEISSMYGLERLDVSNNGDAMKDRDYWTLGGATIPSGNRYGVLSDLARLPKLKSLDLNSNRIFNFSSLKNFPSLEEIWIYACCEESIFGLYGSSGVTNTSTFNALLKKGVAVYVDANNTLYTGGNSHEIVDAIQAISYQKVVPIGADLSLTTAGISTTPSDYWNGKLSDSAYNDIMAVVFVGSATNATTFVVQYTYYKRTILWFYDTITLEFEFDVIRV